MSDTPNIVSVSPEERKKAQEKATVVIQNKPTLERGRPTVITDNRVVLLVAAFQNGMNVRSACVYAGISKDAFYKRYKEDTEFADTIELAKNNLLSKAGTAINAILDDPESRDRGKMARWIYEKRMPEDYGTKPISPNGPIAQQNNFFVLNNGQISDIAKQSDIDASDPSELLEALEEASSLDSGTEEESAA
jgi:hypothetical protein